MKYLYLSILLLLVACSKEGKINECGLVGEWLCCMPTGTCTWTFEDDGDLFIDDFITTHFTWNTEDDCTELVLTEGEDEGKYKIDINGDVLVVHYGSGIGNETLCRQ